MSWCSLLWPKKCLHKILSLHAWGWSGVKYDLTANGCLIFRKWWLVFWIGLEGHDWVEAKVIQSDWRIRTINSNCTCIKPGNMKCICTYWHITTWTSLLQWSLCWAHMLRGAGLCWRQSCRRSPLPTPKVRNRGPLSTSHGWWGMAYCYIGQAQLRRGPWAWF